jgi:hypothetical protein
MKRTLYTLTGIMILALSCKKNDNTAALEDNAAPATMARLCASDEILKKQILEDPKRGQRLEALETETQARMDMPNALQRSTKYYVPVVVHIVLPDPTKVTTAQIQSQIDVLNKDYNATNVELTSSGIYLAGYPRNNVAIANIEFYVSQTIRKVTTASSFGSNDAVKKNSTGGSDAVNGSSMLNMWVCDLSSGLLGYAQFPGGSASTDGVVIDYQAFGLRTAASYAMYSVFDLGRTATHEIGHWFNLRHIWGDRRCGTDYVDDTPAHDASNGGCPSTTLRSNCSGKPLEQWMNYMDYTDDRCMYMFTGGQQNRMEACMTSTTSASRINYMSSVSPN